MRNLVLGLLAASGLALVSAAPAEAIGTRHPYCIQGDEYPGLSACTYDSYQQCAATASGRFLTCIENPYFRASDQRVYRSRRGAPYYPYY
jgi:hypothetical protein